MYFKVQLLIWHYKVDFLKVQVKKWKCLSLSTLKWCFININILSASSFLIYF